MPSPAPTCVAVQLPAVQRLTRARLRAAHLGLHEEGAGGGPMRTRRRLTRAQRRPQELRSRGGWSRDPEERAATAEGARLQREPRVPEDAGARAAIAADDSNDSADGPPRLPACDSASCAHGVRRAPTPLGARDLNSVPGVAAAAAAVPCIADCPASPAGPPASAIALSLAPGVVTSVTAKDALQQRLLLLRRRDGLIDITIRTMKLMRRNQQLQHRLMALQAETRAFVRSVLSNPENRGLRLARAATPVSPAISPPAPTLALALSPASSPALSCSMSPAASLVAGAPTSSSCSSPASAPSSPSSSTSSSASSPSSSPASSPAPSYTPTTC